MVTLPICKSLYQKDYVGSKISLSPFLKEGGGVVMTNDLNLNNKKLINVKKACRNSDGVNLQQLNEAASAITTTMSRLYLQQDGSTKLNGNLNMN